MFLAFFLWLTPRIGAAEDGGLSYRGSFGPGRLNGRCCEAIHHVENAIRSYEAVVQDFYSLNLDEILEEVVSIDEDQGERFLLTAVRAALERLLDLQPQQNNGERQDLFKNRT